MAMGNWCELSFDEEGKRSNGLFTSPAGVTVEQYKNWLYARDKPAWREASGFFEPTVMEIHTGTFRYQDVEVFAREIGYYQTRSAVVWTNGYRYPDKKTRAMASLCAYGYNGNEEHWLDGEQLAFLYATVLDASWFDRDVQKVVLAGIMAFAGLEFREDPLLMYKRLMERERVES